MRGRRLLAAVGACLLALAPGCSLLPRACTAIGWSNAIVIEAPAAVGGSPVVQVCIDSACSPLPGDAETASLASVSREGDEWTASLWDMSTPDEVVVTLADADGAALLERDVELEWVRVGGSEECGGPHEARVDLSV